MPAHHVTCRCNSLVFVSSLGLKIVNHLVGRWQSIWVEVNLGFYTVMPTRQQDYFSHRGTKYRIIWVMTYLYQFFLKVLQTSLSETYIYSDHTATKRISRMLRIK